MGLRVCLSELVSSVDFFFFSVVFAGFSAESLMNRINDGTACMAYYMYMCMYIV